MSLRDRREHRARERRAQQQRDEQQRKTAAVLAAATCHKGDAADSPGVTHAWTAVESGKDQRGPADGYPRGRVRYYSSHECAKCGVNKMDFTEWESID